MSDPNNPNIKNRTTPQWALYQRQGFWQTNDGIQSPFDTCKPATASKLSLNPSITISFFELSLTRSLAPENLERLAEEKLTKNGWHYSSCNAGNSWTHLANRQAFYRHRIIPRMLVDTNNRDTAASIFGHNVAAPIGFAPIGINRIYHPTGELSVAKVANELNLPYTLSSAGSYSIEDVAKANNSGSPRFFQLYQSHDDELCVSMLERAFNNGYDVCVLTTDTWQLAWRHHDVATGNYAFYHEHGAGDIGLQDPVFQKRIREAGLDPEKDKKEVGAKWIDENIWHGKAHSWDKLPWVMGEWKRISGGRPFCLKGIQSVADAKKAVEMGVDGIVVSNHAGRQVDGAIASLDALEDIVDSVGNDIYVSFKSFTDELTVYLPRDSADLTF